MTPCERAAILVNSGPPSLSTRKSTLVNLYNNEDDDGVDDTSYGIIPKAKLIPEVKLSSPYMRMSEF